MNKQKKSKRLMLTTEKVRDLSAEELSEVQGGMSCGFTELTSGSFPSCSGTRPTHLSSL